MEPFKFRKALVIEDDELVAKSIARTVTFFGIPVVDVAYSLKEGLPKIDRHIGLIITDVCLPDGTGVSVLERVRRRRSRAVVIAVSCQASRDQIFEMCSRGVDAYLEKPITASDLRECLASLSEEGECIGRLCANYVGRISFQKVKKITRRNMFVEALKLSNGNKASAAKLLGVDRKCVQRAAEDFTTQSVDGDTTILTAAPAGALADVALCEERTGWRTNDDRGGGMAASQVGSVSGQRASRGR